MEFIIALGLYSLYKVGKALTEGGSDVERSHIEREKDFDLRTANWHFVKRDGQTYYRKGPYTGPEENIERS